MNTNITHRLNKNCSTSLYIKLVLIILTASTATSYSQSKEILELWQQQQDSTQHSIRENQYLTIDDDKIIEMLDNQPSFRMFHDNYFITGVPTNEEINTSSADAKFQISISQRLVKSRLPFNTSLLLTYTQKSFWNVYEYSSPFEENNYNPGFTLMKPIIYNHQLRGGITLAVEHESNGLDSLDSRSWNYMTVSGAYFYNANISLQAKLWLGLLGENTEDLYRYHGYGLLAFNVRNNKDNMWFSLVLNPRDGFRGMNTTVEFNYKPRPKYNQYLFVQWYQGYAESLIDYTQYTSMVRFGICIKPVMRNFY